MKVRYSVDKNPPPALLLAHINPAHILQLHFFEVTFAIVLLSISRSLPSVFPH